MKNSGISEAFREKTFTNFDYSISKSAINAYTIAKAYANNFDSIVLSRNNSIVFMGQCGGGKTHLSLAIANQLMNSGVGVLYMSYRECITSIKQSILDSENYNRAMNKYKNARVLLIDDSFKGNVTPSDINIIFEIINFRYFNNKPIIISTEKMAYELLKIDEAIGSRILEMCKSYGIEMKGNYRLR